MNLEQIKADVTFAVESGEFDRIAPMLRYVVAINPNVTKKEFVAAAVEMGYHPTTAAIQFAKSRKWTIETDAWMVA